MFVHLNKEMYGSVGLLFLFVLSVVLSPLAGVVGSAYGDDIPLKEVEELGSRLRHTVTSWRTYREQGGNCTEYTVQIMNLGIDSIYPPIRMVFDSISVPNVTLQPTDGEASGHPYIQFDAADIPGGVLNPGESIEGVVFTFKTTAGVKVTYSSSFLGRMEQKGLSFASVGVNPMGDLSDHIDVIMVRMRLNRARGGVEHTFKLKNIGNVDIYGPARLIIDSISIPDVTVGDKYGDINGKPYLIIEGEIQNGVLKPGEQTDEIKCFFDNNTRKKVNFTTKSDAHLGYYYDLSSMIGIEVEEVLTELGVSRYSLQIKNQAQDLIEGPVRVNINGVTIGGTPYAGSMAEVIQSESGVLNQIPFQIMMEQGVSLASLQTKSIEIVCANPDELPLDFDIKVEALYDGLSLQSGVVVLDNGKTNNSTEGTTTYSFSLRNDSTGVISSPVMFVISDIDNEGISVVDPDGYLNGKPFFEFVLSDGEFNFAEVIGPFDVVFSNSGQVNFVLTTQVQGLVLQDDIISPVTEHDYTDDGVWVNQDVTINFTAFDNDSGVKETRYSINGAPEVVGTQAVISLEGTYTIDYHSEDNAGNVELFKQVVVKLDKSPPDTEHVYSYEGVWFNNDAVITLNATDSLSDIENMYYNINSAGWVSYSSDITIDVNGTHTVEYRSEDVAGNSESVKTLVVMIDKSVPDTSCTGYSGGWVRFDVSLVLTPTDDFLSDMLTHYTINSGSVQTGNNVTIDVEGENSFEYWTTDEAGNEETHKTLQVQLDKSAPVTTDDHTGNDIIDNVTITLTAVDPLSDVDFTKYILDAGDVQEGNSVYVSGEGDHTIEYWSMDNVGNQEAHKIIHVNVILSDITPPVTTHNYLKHDVWANEEPVITLSATDNSSGVKATYYQINAAGWNQYTAPLTMTNGIYTIEFKSVDNSDNEESVQSVIVKYDNTVPSIGYTGYSGGWVNTDVNIVLSVVSDGLSPISKYYTIDAGPAQMVDSFDVVDEGDHAVEYWAQDEAGNEETPHKSLQVKIDRTPPSTSDDHDGNDVIESATITLSPSDALSDVASTEYILDNGGVQTGVSVYVSGEGVHTLEYWSTDNADNEETHNTIQITVVLIDIIPPVTTHNYSNDGVWVSNNVLIRLTATDEGTAGLKETRYRINSGQEVVGTRIDIKTAGIYYVSFWSIDNADNEELPHHEIVVKLDKTPPVSSDDYSHVGEWFTVGQTVTLSGSDTLSGLRDIMFKINGGVTQVYDAPIFINTEGANSLVYWADDFSGNEESPQNTVIIQIDQSPPVTTLYNGGFPATGTLEVLNNANLTLSATDTLSGVFETKYQIDSDPVVTGNNISISAGGTFIIKYWSIDNMGFEESVNELTLTVSGVPPALYVSSPSPDSVLVTNSLTVDILGETDDSDATVRVLHGAGTKEGTITGDQFEILDVPLTEGDVYYTVEVENLEGLKRSEYLRIIRDTTPPAIQVDSPSNNIVIANSMTDISGTVLEDNSRLFIENDGGTDVEVSLDAQGAFLLEEYPLSEGLNEIVFYAIDSLGNTSKDNDGEVVLNVTSDLTPPEISLEIALYRENDGQPGAKQQINSADVTFYNQVTKLDIYGEVNDLQSIVRVNSEGVNLENDGSFQVIGLELSVQEGAEGLVVVSARDTVNNMSMVDIHLIKDTTGPEIFVTSFENGDITSDDSPITVSGVARETDLVNVSGVEVAVVSERFDRSGLVLSEGVNEVLVYGYDHIGNTTTVSYNLILDTIAPGIVTVSSPVESSSYTNKPKIFIHGSAEALSSVSILGGALDVETDVDVAGFFTKNVFMNANISNVLLFSASDLAGNEGDQTSITVIHDNVKPQINVISPVVAQIETSEIYVNALASDDVLLADNVEIKLMDNESIIIEEYTIAHASGSFNKLIQLDNEGDYTLYIYIYDKAGNEKIFEFAFNYTCVVDDFDGPELLILSPENNSYTNDKNISLTGSCRDRSGVSELSISIDSGTYQSVSSFDNDTGDFSHAFFLDNEGAHIISVRAVDGESNVSAENIVVNIDTVPPLTAPTVSGVTPSLDLDNDAYLTKAGCVKLIGSYQAGYTVRAQSDEETVETVADANGIYRLDIHITEDSQNNIENIIVLVGIDLAGNVSTDLNPDLKTSISVTYDAVPPVVSSIEPLDGSTNVSLASPVTITFSESMQLGSLSDNQGNRMYVSDSQDSLISGTIVSVGGTDDSVFQLVLPVDVSYPDGEQLTVTVMAGVKDDAGNLLANAFVSHFTTLDDTPPDVPVVTNVLPGSVTNSTVVNVIGTAEALAVIEVYRAEVMIASDSIDASGNFDIQVVLLTDQLNELTFYAKDASENKSDASNVLSVTHDGVLPNYVSITPVVGSVGILKNTVFEVKFDETIVESTLSSGFSITGKDDRVIDGSLLLISAGDNDSIEDAGFRFTPSSLLLDGETVSVTLTSAIQDVAGNGVDFVDNGGLVIFTYIVEDDLPPAKPVLETVSEESPTTQLSLDVTGSAEPKSMLLVSGGDIPLNGLEIQCDNDTGAFQVTIPLKSDNNNVITFKARDWADNISEGETLTMYCDITPPTITNVMPVSGSPLEAAGLFTVVFNEEIDAGTINGSVVLMQDLTPVPASLNLSASGNIVTLKSDDPIDPNMPHVLVVKTTIADLAGNNLEQEREFTYLTNDPIIPEMPVVLQMSTGSPTTATQVSFMGTGNSMLDTIKALDEQGVILGESSLVDNEGLFLFDMTISLSRNEVNVIKIVAERPSGNRSQPVTIYIRQDDMPPSIDILVPSDSVTLPTDSVTLIASINDAGSISSCKVNGAQRVLNINSSGYLTTKVDGLTDGDQISIVAEDILGNSSTETMTVSISIEDPNNDSSGPVITIVSPEDGAKIDATTVNLFGTVEDASEISLITINDNESINSPDEFPTSASLFNGDVKLLDGVNTVTVKVWDIHENMSELSINLDVDIAPPVLVISSPDHEAVFTESNVTITGTITDSNAVAGLKVNGNDVSYDNDGNFTLPLDLDEGKNTFVFEGKDVADNTVEKEIDLYYDVIGPEIVLIHPTDGEAGLPSDTSMYAKFSERLDPMTVSTNTVKLFYLDETGDEVKEITGNVQLTRDTVYFSPSTYLEPGASYRFKVLSGIKDLVGFGLQNPMRVEFSVDEKITVLAGMALDPVSGKGLADVTVSIVGTDIDAKTDLMGNFYIEKDNIPTGFQNIFFDGTTANGDEGVSYTQSMVKIFINPNQLNVITREVALPSIKAETVTYVNGMQEQVIDFNGEITGSFADNDTSDAFFNMTVPAGGLEFPNGSSSGVLSAQLVHETFLPYRDIGDTHRPPVSAVWFHPFGVKCNEPVRVEIPFPTDRGENNVAPGERYFIVSYSTETCEWEDVGLGYASDDGKTLIMGENDGLTELTIVAIIPFAIEGELETGMTALRKVGYGGDGEGDFMLMELMVCIAIMSMMHMWDICMWKVVSHKYGGAEEVRFPGVKVDISDTSRIKISSGSGYVVSHAFFPVFPSLIALLVCMSMDYPVVATMHVQTAFPGCIRKFPVMGQSLWHAAFGPSVKKSRIYVDQYGFNGSLRYLDEVGAPDPSALIKVHIFSDVTNGRRAGSLTDGMPCRTFSANKPSFEPGFSKGYVGFAYGSAMWGGAFWNRGGRAEDLSNPDHVERYWWSFIRAGGDLRIVAKYGDFIGEVYTKAPVPVVNPITGIIHKIDVTTNVTLGRMNVDVYAERKYNRVENGITTIVSQMIGYNGLAMGTDTQVSLHTGIAMANGDTSPGGNYCLFGKLTGATEETLTIPPNSGIPWTSQPPEEGKYEVKVYPDRETLGEEGKELFINISTISGAVSGTSGDRPAQTRPARGRGSRGRGSYVPPRSQRRSSRRTPVVREGKKEYVFYVCSRILPIDNAPNLTVRYANWQSWYDNADPNHIPTVDQPTAIYDSSRGKNVIYVDHRIPIKVEIPISSLSDMPTGASLVIKLTQSGAPYLLGLKYIDGMFPLRRHMEERNGRYAGAEDYIDPEDPNGIPGVGVGATTFMFDGKHGGGKVIFDIVPHITSLNDSEGNGPNGNATFIIQYLDKVNGDLGGMFTNRYWLIEIIDKASMKPTEVYSHPNCDADFDIMDAVYNQLERMIIYVE